MACIRIWVEPQHRDGSICSHAITASGKPRDPATGCTGRVRYQVRCSEHGAVDDAQSRRSLAEAAQNAHRDEHRAVLACRAA